MIVSGEQWGDSAVQIRVSFLPQTQSHPGCCITSSRVPGAVYTGGDANGFALSLGPFPNWGWGLQVKETESCSRLFYFSPGWVLLWPPRRSRWAPWKKAPRGGDRALAEHLILSLSNRWNWNGLLNRLKWQNWNDKTQKCACFPLHIHILSVPVLGVLFYFPDY